MSVNDLFVYDLRRGEDETRQYNLMTNKGHFNKLKREGEGKHFD